MLKEKYHTDDGFGPEKQVALWATQGEYMLKKKNIILTPIGECRALIRLDSKSIDSASQETLHYAVKGEGPRHGYAQLSTRELC